MRISDWSSDVCSADRLVERETRRGDAKVSIHAQREQRLQVRAQRVPIDVSRERESAELYVAQHQLAHRRRVQRERRQARRAVDEQRAAWRHGVEARGQYLAAGRIARSEEHTSELQSLMRSSYAVFCLKKKN